MNADIEILLVEDNANDAEMTIRTLKKNNLANKLLYLKDGSLALDFLFCEGTYAGREVKQLPRLIMLDLKMPKVSGIEVIERLKKNDRTKHIPIVVLTSSKEDPDIKTCYDLGVNGYVVKPVEFDDFHQAISQLGLFWMLVNQAPQ